MPEHFLQRPGARLHFVETGGGAPVLFQHGLGGDAAQAAEVFPDDAGYRRLTLECRAQGQSEGGPAEHFSIASFADDALALADARGAARFVAGGISMGSAIALRLALLHPARVRGLVLVRPAWLFQAGPDNMRPFAEAAGLLASLPPAEAKQRFIASATASHLRATAPDNLASLLGFFDKPNPDATAALLSRIAADGPGVSQAQAEALPTPALVIGHGIEFVHPLAYAERLAAVLPHATLVRVTPKATSRAAYVAEVRAAIAAFLLSLHRMSP